MTMNRSIEAFRRLGDGDFAQRQAEILAEFQKRHPGLSDIALRGKLPQTEAAKPEVILPPLSAETQRLVEQMRDDGYAVYDTQGRTPISLKPEGMRYLYLNPALGKRTAPPALLAFKTNPEEFFLPGSHNIPHAKQVELIPGEQARVDKAYPNMGLVVREGKLPEWTELVLRHFKETSKIGSGVRIFGRDYGYNYTWTDTYENVQPGARRAHFGYWSETSGAVADLWSPDDVDPDGGLVPLIEIPRK